MDIHFSRVLYNVTIGENCTKDFSLNYYLQLHGNLQFSQQKFQFKNEGGKIASTPPLPEEKEGKGKEEEEWEEEEKKNEGEETEGKKEIFLYFLEPQ